MDHQEYKEYDAEISKLLDENTTSVYFIEYEGFLTNHINHGIRALQMLRAPLSTVRAFIDRYRKKLEPADLHKKRELAEDDKRCSLGELIGARKSFYVLYDHYFTLLNEKYSKRCDALVRGEFPKLSRGIVGSALHTLIHLGYGVDSGLAWFVCEGLAYLHYYYVPLRLSASCPSVQSFGHGDTEILHVLEELRQDNELIRHMNEALKLDPGKDGEFQRKTGVLFSEKGDVLLSYANKLKLPKQSNKADFALEDMPNLLTWLINSAITVHAISEKRNDFFLIHGVTSSWALRNVLRCLNDVHQIMDTVRTFVCALFATYVAQGCPILQVELLRNNPGKAYDWRDIVQKALAIETEGDEHIYKLVQVCKQMTEESTDEAMRDVYKLAAYRCVTNPMLF